MTILISSLAKTVPEKRRFSGLFGISLAGIIPAIDFDELEIETNRFMLKVSRQPKTRLNLSWNVVQASKPRH
jgi:hypothetical protein